VAARDAVNQLLDKKVLSQDPIKDHVAAISVGIYQGVPVLDLDYAEDSACDTDMNVVMTGQGGIIEVQGTAEGAAFSRTELDQLLSLAESGIKELVQLQKVALSK
jgi:ribonuclease PH